MKLAKTVFTILLLSVFFIPSGFVQVVHADVAPPPAPQLGGLEPFGYQETNVQMVYERVEMELRPFLWSADDFSKARVNVTAYFTMHNQGTTPETMQAIFPLESFTECEPQDVGIRDNYTYYTVTPSSFEVLLNGKGVPVQNVVTKHPHEGCEQMNWAGFDVTFPVQEGVTIRVEYIMESVDMDLMQTIEYILETGAGWAGPIQRGEVIVKFPYEVTTENVLAESTPGYQVRHNELVWSFENLEPTSKDNLQISIVSPAAWQYILSLRRELKANPVLPEKWIELAQLHEYLSTSHIDVRNEYYYQKVADTYEQGITANPNSAALHSAYAWFVYHFCCFYNGEETDPAEEARALDLLNKALALDAEDSVAQEVLGYMKDQNPDFVFTPPAALLPTATPLFTATPSVTPSPTLTFMPDDMGMSMIVTVVQTKLVEAPTSTPRPEPAAIGSPTQMVAPNENQNGTTAPRIILGILLGFLVGMGAGRFWQRRARK